MEPTADRSGAASAAVAWTAVAWTAAGALLLLLALVIVRLPWAGDLGMHAATIERLRHSLTAPGNPLVDADTPSPYYSPWTVLLGAFAKVTGLGTFTVLRIAAAVGLILLVTGVWRFVRTLSAHRAAPAVAVLCVLLLWGTERFDWSGFPGLGSLALTVAYPSTFALGLAFHLWAGLRGALRTAASWWVFLGLGLLWAVVLLSHQFSGVVATIGVLAMLAGARPWPGEAVWLRLAAGLALGVALLNEWPYYFFFRLLTTGGGLDAIHQSLYRQLLPHVGLALLGVVALALRWRRDRRDPLVIFFAIGAVVFAAGGVTGHYAWGRVLPAALIPAQVAAAVEVFEARGVAVRRAFGGVLCGALAVGMFSQSGTLGYVVPLRALPSVVAEKYRAPWVGYRWVVPWVRYGDVVMAQTFPARQIPAYGGYTVAPGYPDVFLADEGVRGRDRDLYYSPSASDAERGRVLREYGVRWVVGGPVWGGVRAVATGPQGLVLYEVVRG
ncbi:hypothetical protein ACIQNU_00115 [Streptomyces sp. NPDC091292]|uniref:hypothetical protein n=1 Tax=Streptomyces sp. NPDC091292 TaxID=3365991 RepID=UPI0037FD59AD